MNRLTDRQKEVAGMIADGYTDKQIQAHLGVSASTLRCHIELIVARWDLDRSRNIRVQIAWLVIDDRYDKDPNYRHPDPGKTSVAA